MTGSKGLHQAGDALAEKGVEFRFSGRHRGLNAPLNFKEFGMLSGENTEFLFVDGDFNGGYEDCLEHSGYAQGPERALLAAILFDAVQVLLAGRSLTRASDTAALRETQAWLLSSDREYVFSFENVCEGLGLNPEYLRLGIINACNARRFRHLRKRD